MALGCPPKGPAHSSHTSLTSAGAHYCSSCPGHVPQPLPHQFQQLPFLWVPGSLFAPEHPTY